LTKTAELAAPRSVMALVLREMSSTYGNSPGGYVWAVLQPIGMIVVLSFGFSLLFRTPSLGTSFILFYATGYLPYDMYTQLSQKVGTSIKYSRSMLTYPRVVWLDAILARFVLNFLTLLTVFCIVITGVLLIVNTPTIISLTPVLLGISIAALVGLGVGVMNCLLVGLFPVWGIIWKIATRPMFIASGVLFIYEDMGGLVQTILWWNPILHVTGLVRSGFYASYEASYVSLTYCFGLALTLICFGLLFLQANHKQIVNN